MNVQKDWFIFGGKGMLTLAIGIISSTIISLLFKWFEKIDVDNLPTIVINYFVCFFAGWLVEGAFPIPVDVYEKSWLWIALMLGFFFIGGFSLNAYTLQKTGIAVTSVFQRLSLLLSVLASIFLFGDYLTPLQFAGIFLGIIAVYLTSGIKDIKESKKDLLLLLSVFFMAGFIEVFISIAQRNHGAGESVAFTVLLFLWAGVLGFVWMIWELLNKRIRVNLKTLVCGVLLGVPNFFSIYMIVKSLENGLSPAVVFTVMNVGTILLSSLLALLLFKEQLTKKQWVGIIFASFAVLLISLKLQ